jgi:hypothetical protein
MMASGGTHRDAGDLDTGLRAMTLTLPRENLPREIRVILSCSHVPLRAGWLQRPYTPSKIS